ncbi:dihydrolipoyllysine-residue succinyltransferase [Buchnera aphidicola (Macrosiphoniella sanborni)]|uniref:Dihydrolipoyllysine-residue succinyltransferase n=1 Tax=Buchnera aphidicola (Macrosiphoniella sanborni) TaxID=1241865 RepID=A0A4D6YBI2_9GAMM|nr:dihydrolipoyllysine-residue succinyltransferase [Buchnera aphidicola]QCI23841.1 dihydrolipoyllysine-residue succinyltransferase [Buchnera aphidicola (Macrosiphoniella sanborni)]
MKIINILVPDLPESISNATIVKWHKKVGEIVNYNDNIVDIETDKVMLEVSSPCNGILKSILEKEGQIVNSHQILGEIDQLEIIKNNNINHNILEKKKYITDLKQDSVDPEQLSFILENKKEHFTPSIRRLIKKNKINHDVIKDIIKKNDKKNLQNILKKNTEESNTTISNNNFEKRVKMSQLRQTISKRLLDSTNNMAMLTTFNEVNMKPIITLREKYGEDFQKKHGIRMGFMSFFVKSVVESLKKFPQINAYIDNTDIVFYKHFDINIAISTPRGLITPVLRHVENMTMSDIEKKIKELSLKGHENKINFKELTGGNFTITNGGVFGSLMSTPIINPPQAAILGMHVIQERPVVVKGKIEILPMMYIALSYDHRLVDGRESVQFLMSIKNILEDFVRILIDI